MQAFELSVDNRLDGPEAIFAHFCQNISRFNLSPNRTVLHFNASVIKNKQTNKNCCLTEDRSISGLCSHMAFSLHHMALKYSLWMAR